MITKEVTFALNFVHFRASFVLINVNLEFELLSIKTFCKRVSCGLTFCIQIFHDYFKITITML